MKKTTLALRAGGVLGAAALLSLAAPLAASAHVHVEPGQAEAGSYSTLTFKVPNESADAGTVRFVVDLPTDTPFTSVSYEPVPGWSTEVATGALPEPVDIDGATVTTAPVTVTWTADEGAQIAPGQFQQFVISAGAVPDTGSILLPSHQEYSDGSVVDWDEPAPASGEEPEHPAPTLYVNDTPPDEGHSDSHAVGEGADASSDASSDDAAVSASGDSDASSTAGVAFGIGGLAFGAVALVVSVVALTRRPAAGGRGGRSSGGSTS
ncbi:DUF1775 domain-containing protein [Frigoribacterium sp. CFBP 13712]|uniref:YcnI family copper-binding membrane protein n=1 Tax=Frigoribacterium sp. CFBP 13712 TaxID=2775309 RepID=UPI001783CE43|nr:YcnI family protein [Frigoribacterium sp. CFBP 13712]